MEIKPCPFCGKKAVIYTVPYIKKTTHFKKNIPEEAINIKEFQMASKTIWSYNLKGYCPQCSDSSCLGRSRKKFFSEYAAIKAWNDRKGESNERA